MVTSRRRRTTFLPLLEGVRHASTSRRAAAVLAAVMASPSPAAAAPGPRPRTQRGPTEGATSTVVLSQTLEERRGGRPARRHLHLPRPGTLFSHRALERSGQFRGRRPHRPPVLDLRNPSATARCGGRSNAGKEGREQVIDDPDAAGVLSAPAGERGTRHGVDPCDRGADLRGRGPDADPLRTRPEPRTATVPQPALRAAGRPSSVRRARPQRVSAGSWARRTRKVEKDGPQAELVAVVETLGSGQSLAPHERAMPAAEVLQDAVSVGELQAGFPLDERRQAGLAVEAVEKRVRRF